MSEDDRNPFKHRNVVEAMLGDAPSPARGSGLPTALDALEREKAERERRAKLRKMKPWQRRKYERDRQRVKIKFTVYVPVSLLEVVEEIARYNVVAPSSAALWLIAVGLKLWQEGKVPSPQTTRSRNLRTERSLVIPPEWDGERRRRTFEFSRFGEEIYSLADRYKCGRSDAVAWLMSVGATAYRAGMQPEREASDSIRYPFRLKLPRARKAARKDEERSPADILRLYLDKGHG